MAARRWRWLWVVFGVSVLGIGAAAWWTVHAVNRMSEFQRVARTLPDELAAARREHIPITPADLRRVPPVPDAENAAPLYRELDHKMRALPDAVQDTLIDFLTPAKRAPLEARVRAIVQQRASIIALAERASRLPYCDFRRPFEQGPNMMFPEYGSARAAARLLAAKAILLNEAGDWRAALDAVGAGARIGRHMGEDPMLIAMLVDIAIRAIMDRTFGEVVLAHASDRAIVPAAERVLSDFGPAPDLTYNLRGEVVLGMVVVDEIRRGKSEDIFAQLKPRSAAETRAMMCDAWQARSLDFWRHGFAALRAHPRDVMAQYRAFAAVDNRASANDGKPTYELNAILAPVFSRAALKLSAMEALARLRETMVQLVAYRQHHGAYPAALGDLAPPAPLDVFTGQPLHYRRTPKGFLLYSVGENLRDDGGSTAKSHKGDPPLDMVLEAP